jgi:hypothetical protein
METETIEPRVPPGGWEPALAGSGDEFKIVVVYQGAPARDWARQVCQPVREKFGGEYVQDTWHEVNSLGNIENLIVAVRATLRADVIVIAIQAAEELPPELCAWIDVWLPRRHARSGALAALIGVTGQPEPHEARTQEYLQAVARRGQLEFVTYDHPPQTGSDVCAHPTVTRRPGAGRVSRLTAAGQAEFRF